MAGSRGTCRMSVVWRNVKIDESRQDAAAVFAHWGAFTTAGCDQGRPLLWPRHVQRLAGSLVDLGADNAVSLPTDQDVRELLDAAGLDGPARVRVVARRIDSSRWNIEASAMPCDAVGPRLEPARLAICRWVSAPPLAGHKTLARLAWDLARERAQQKGADDALLVDSADNLLETSVANVWVLTDGAARTPRAPELCLPGVMRGWLLENLGRTGLSAEVGELTLPDLVSADEIWISNSVAGVRRVGEIDGQRWREWPQYDLLEDLGIPAPGWSRAQRRRRR
jgi:branched-subunit amino acid aminotransferase/4-amino-4-deoxychorismate lyase